MRRLLAQILGAVTAASLACFSANAPLAPCTGWSSCPDDQHCDPIAHRCAAGSVAPAVISGFTASPARVACGSDTTLTAVFSGAQGDTGTIDPAIPGIGSVVSGAAIRVGQGAPASRAPIVYTLTVKNAVGRPTTQDVKLYVSNVFWLGPQLAAATSGSEGATATRLRDGRVLIAGGSGTQIAAIFDATGNQGSGALVSTGYLGTGRRNGTATLLRDGRVLVAGGSADGSAELFSGDAFSQAPGLRAPRFFATATLLPSGKVLIAGGGDAAGASPLDSAELFAITGGVAGFSAAGTLATARTKATATLLLDGRVLIAGGFGKDGQPLSSVELYDPDGNGGAGSFRSAGSLVAPRGGAAAALLPSGRVLFAGGSVVDASGSRSGALASAELYDPAANGGAGSSTSLAAKLATARSDASAVLLGNGQVLITGGREATTGFPLAGSELFDPAGAGGAGTFSSVCDPLFPRSGRVGAAVALLPDGRVLVAGGQPTSISTALNSEIFDPAGLGAPGELGTFSWASSGRFSWPSRVRATATLLRNGNVLVAGGTDGSTLQTAVMLWQPAGLGQPAQLLGGVWLQAARLGATATLLRDGRVLVAGGHDDTSYLASAEIYTPAADGPGSFAATGSLQTARSDATAVLLPDGRVAVFGGRSAAGGLDTVEVFDASGNGGVGSFTQLEPRMMQAGFLSTATLLPTGEVLIAGGTGDDGRPQDAAQLFDPAGGSGAGSFRWTGHPASGTLYTPRSSPLAVLLPTGKVLFAGGYGPGDAATDTAELYDVSGEFFTAAGNLTMARALATATLLPNGKVLIEGGRGPSSMLDTAELYDPFAARFVATGPVDAGNQYIKVGANSTATLLRDGRVLIAGGEDDSGTLPGWFFYGLE